MMKRVELLMMREWTEKIQGKEMNMVMRMIRLKTRKPKSLLKSRRRRSKNRTRSRLLSRRNSSLKRKNHRFQELHGDKKRKKKRSRRKLMLPNRKRTTRFWHQCRPTGRKKRRPSSRKNTIMTHNSSTIAPRPINVS